MSPSRAFPKLSAPTFHLPVTLWNLDPAKASAVPDHLYKDICSPLFDVNKETVFSPKGFPNDFTDEIVFNMSHKLEDMLLDCSFKGMPCSAEDFEAVASPFPYSNWGIGYTFNPGSSKRTDIAGPRGGLQLVLSIEADDYCPRTWGRGVRVHFHDHRDLAPEVASTHINPDLGSTVTPGHRWSFGLENTAYSLLGEPYSPPCIDLAGGDEYPDPLSGWKCVSEECPGVNFRSITKYNIRSFTNPCVRDCFRLKTYRFCEGVSYKIDVGQEVLDRFGSNLRMEDFEDADTLRALRQSKTLRKYIKNSEKRINEKKFSEVVDVINEAVQRDLVVIDVFYKEIIKEVKVEVPPESLWTLVAEIGGMLGLFLGASAATLFEIGEIFGILCCRCARRRPPKTNNQTAHNPRMRDVIYDNYAGKVTGTSGSN